MRGESSTLTVQVGGGNGREQSFNTEVVQGTDQTARGAQN